MAREISLAVNWIRSIESQVQASQAVAAELDSPLLVKERFCQWMPIQESCFVPGNCLGHARCIESICSHEQISVSLIRFVRQHLWTPWFRDDSVQNAYLMQALSTQDSSILDDEPFRQLCLVTFQVTTHSKPDETIPVHTVNQEFATMGEDACTAHPLFEVMIQEMITDNEFESLSCILHPIPATPSKLERVFR